MIQSTKPIPTNSAKKIKKNRANSNFNCEDICYAMGCPNGKKIRPNF